MANQNAENVAAALGQVTQAQQLGKITESAVKNLTAWLTEDRYRDYRSGILDHIQAGRWQELDNVFWTIIPFGTGGRRGRMYPFGSNAINDRTIGESAQGLADYIRDFHGGKTDGLSCAIAYDTRHNSRHFAELCASIMVAAGFKVYFLDDYRATPQLSFAVRHQRCACGIMVTASHNPPSDNAVKVYWSTGGQVLPPHDEAIIDRVMRVQDIRTVPFADALAAGKIEIITQKIDAAYTQAASEQSLSKQRNAKILYTPLHGVGAAAVIPLLNKCGFNSVEVYGPHATPSGDFPNVPGHVSNPENTAVFNAPIEYARQHGFDVILATDPDCDRLGVAAPLTNDSKGEWGTLTGNQIGALLGDYVLSQRKKLGKLSNKHFTISTLVSSGLMHCISESYGCRPVDDLLVGFKWIAGVMDREGPDLFAYGYEESHGYLVGQYARDKDGAVACLLMSELVAELKSSGTTLHQHLEVLYKRHGRHVEHLINVMMEGSEGMAAMKRLMAGFRQCPPKSLGGLKVVGVRDYEQMVTILPDGSQKPLAGPKGDLVVLDLEQEGNSVAVRPSGTEPKVKFYVLTRLPVAESQDAVQATALLKQRLQQIETDVRQYAKT